jgi:hypothetical protein
MRTILLSWISWTILTLLSTAALAQQSAPTLGETIGSPPPISGPPPAPLPPPPDAAPQADHSAPPTPEKNANAVTDIDPPKRVVKSVRCSASARETDGSTTCIGIPDERVRNKRR